MLNTFFRAVLGLFNKINGELQHSTLSLDVEVLSGRLENPAWGGSLQEGATPWSHPRQGGAGLELCFRHQLLLRKEKKLSLFSELAQGKSW